jgi:hypothetical protein
MLRMLVSVMVAAASGMVMGACVGRAHFTSNRAQRREFLAMGLGGSVLLHALVWTLLFTKIIWSTWLALPVCVLGLLWGRKLFMALRHEQERLFHVLAHRDRLLAEGGWDTETPEVEWAGAPRQPLLERTTWAWVKLGLGSLGLCFCGVLWWSTGTTFHAKPAPLGVGDYVAFVLIMLFFDVLPTWLCFQLFLSGLREPRVASPIS